MPRLRRGMQFWDTNKVGRVGLEPTRWVNQQKILSLRRLPFRHRPSVRYCNLGVITLPVLRAGRVITPIAFQENSQPSWKIGSQYGTKLL